MSKSLRIAAYIVGCLALVSIGAQSFEGSVRASSRSAISEVCAASNFSLAVDESGTLWTWGNNSFGQLGTRDRKSKNRPVSVMKNVKKAVCGGTFMLAISNSGKLYGWGDNANGQLGNSDAVNSLNPELILTGVANVAAGNSHVLALDNEGNLYSWGLNASGQLGAGSKENHSRPSKIMSGIKFIAASGDSSYAISVDGELFAWGENGDGQLGVGGTEDRIKPFSVLEDVESVVAGQHSACASVSSKTGARVYIWGDNSFKQITSQRPSLYTRPIDITREFVFGGSFALGKNHTAMLFGKDIYARGSNIAGQTGPNKPNTEGWALVSGIHNIVGLTAGEDHTIALNRDGTVYAWGDNSSGQLGVGDSKYINTPTELSFK